MQFIFILFFLLLTSFSPHLPSSLITPVYGMDGKEKNKIEDEGKVEKSDISSTPSKISSICTNHAIKGKRPFLSFALSNRSLGKITIILNELDKDLQFAQKTPPIGVKGVTNLHSTISMSKFPFMTIGGVEDEITEKDELGLLTPDIADRLIHFIDVEEKGSSSKVEGGDNIKTFLPLISNYNMLDILKAQSIKPDDFKACQLDYADYYYYKLLKILLKKINKPFGMTFIPTQVEALGKRFTTIIGTYKGNDKWTKILGNFLNINNTPHISLVKYDNNVQAKVENVIRFSYFHTKLTLLLNKYFKVANNLVPSELSNNSLLLKDMKVDLYNLGKYPEILKQIQENFKKTLLQTLEVILKEWRIKLSFHKKEAFYDEVIKDLIKDAAVDNIDDLKNLATVIEKMRGNWSISVSQISKSIINGLWEKYKIKDIGHGEIENESPPEYSIKAIFMRYEALLTKLFMAKQYIEEIIPSSQKVDYRPLEVKALMDFLRNQEIGNFYSLYKDINPKTFLKDLINIIPDIKSTFSGEVLTLLKNHKILSSIQAQVPEVRNFKALAIDSEYLHKSIIEYLDNITISNGVKCTEIKASFNGLLKDLDEKELDDLSSTIKLCAITNFLKTQYGQKKDPITRIRSYLKNKNPQLKFDNVSVDVNISTAKELITALFHTDSKYISMNGARILNQVEKILKEYKNIIMSKGVTSIPVDLREKLVNKFSLTEEWMLKIIKYIESKIIKGVHRNRILNPEKPDFDISIISKKLVIEDMDDGSLDDRSYLSRLIVRNLMRLYDVLLEATGNPNKVMSYGDYIKEMGIFIKKYLPSGPITEKDALDEIELIYEH